jgi:PPK2 family polyphosphate:nucleotide phosphotransferase
MQLRKRLRVPLGGRFRLASVDPDSTPGMPDKQQVQDRLQTNVAKLAKLQYRMYAENRRALLIVLQAMDAGGKDGTIRHVMSGLNPQGCSVASFKKPSIEEADHDFLWRIHAKVPAKGDFGIFNRSHYEDVLVVRVHNLVAESVWSKRYQQINAFERILAENEIIIVKFWLHISKEEQLARLRARLEDPTKLWKFSEADLEERSHWDNYMKAVEVAVQRCSTRDAPWYVIPANKKWYRNAAVSEILVETLEVLDMKFPPPTVDPRRIRLR